MRISLPLQLIAIIAFVALFGGLLPLNFIRACFTFSVLFKELLAFLLPFIVFFFVITGILSFKKRAPLVLTILIISIFISNAAASLVTYGLMWLIFPLIRCGGASSVQTATTVLEPFFTLHLPTLIRSEHALLLALIVGIVLSFFSVPRIQAALFVAKEWLAWLVNLLIISLLPVYILGFLLKTRYEGGLLILMREYSGTMLLIVSLQVAYLLWVYYVAAGFSLRDAVRYFHTALPSYLTAFSSMSSTATIPVSTEAAVKNTNDRPLAELALPIMANIHLLGDAISTPLLAMMTMILFKGALPSFFTYLAFVFYFCTSMFAVSGIPGGGIIVMIPVLIAQLQFTPEMVGIMTALYLLMDSFGTAANVMGDGALTILVHKLLKKIGVR